MYKNEVRRPSQFSLEGSLEVYPQATASAAQILTIFLILQQQKACIFLIFTFRVYSLIFIRLSRTAVKCKQ